MIKIEDFKQLGLSITWRLLKIAMCEKYILEEEIIEYAIEKLEEGDDRSEICELAGSYSNEKEDIYNLLCELVQQENSGDEFERRKLRAVIVGKAIKKKNNNYINGLMDLTDIWSSLEYPSDSPHVIQGRNNNIVPNEYYTDDNYIALYQKHIEWLNKEIKYLTENQII